MNFSSTARIALLSLPLSSMTTGLFYAYAKYINDGVTFRYLIVFSTRDVADNWWRAVCDSVASGYTRFAEVQRVSPQFYTHDPYKANITDTITDSRCAGNFLGKVFFTLLGDRDGRILDTAPVLNYTDHLSGGRYFIRSALDPATFWYYDRSKQVVVASNHQRTKFYVHMEDDKKPRGTVMVGSDDVFLSIDPNTNIGVVNRDGVDRLGHSQSPFRFRFSDFIDGFEIEYDFDSSGSNVIARSPVAGEGERWELAA